MNEKRYFAQRKFSGEAWANNPAGIEAAVKLDMAMRLAENVLRDFVTVARDDDLNTRIVQIDIVVTTQH